MFVYVIFYDGSIVYIQVVQCRNGLNRLKDSFTSIKLIEIYITNINMQHLYIQCDSPN